MKSLTNRAPARGALTLASASLLLTLTACAGDTVTLKNYSFASEDQLAAAAILDEDRPSRDHPLVVVRYPAIIDSSATNLFEQLYDGRGFLNVFFNPPPESELIVWRGKRSSSASHPAHPRDMQGASREAIAKTTYLALDLYDYLAARLPPGSVALQPTTVTRLDPRLDWSGLVTDAFGVPDRLALHATSLPPAPLYLDVFAYVDPYWRVEGETTFGDTIVPVLTLRTAPEAKPATRGAIATMEAFLPYLAGPEDARSASEGMGVHYTTI
jgi:hypothetical protein